MARAHSPLRYPGGKSSLYELVSNLLRLNALQRGHYAEPYAGGASLALSLLFNGQVSDIHLNDVDRGIWSFWKSVLEETDDLCELIENTEISVEEWHRQKAIYRSVGPVETLALGFATFFLNRTNRSGIIGTGGIIGGLQQTGNYKIDCRFNKSELIRRIRRIRKYRSRIHLSQEDALVFLSNMDRSLPRKSFIALDPPYYQKGASLYTSFYGADDHAEVARAILSIDRPWVLTYDDAHEVRQLYRCRRQYLFDIRYSVQTKRTGTELLIASKGLKVPEEIKGNQVHRPQYRKAA
ncbi:DNA methyltransferase [Qipengyuania flava]|uniref:DNA adenine methylase n=1 Tax=Qipengyuania flava TaxID=192812 RepID=UPI000B8BD6FE|nr:DNA adenine methylase [Qipengyuania flava]ASP30425.1 DNA methyltransferase [Qipengyuania flava]